MILAEKIIDLRKKNGWSQEELADKLGVSRQAVSKWEGAQSIPDLERILGMSRLFGVSTDYLLKDENEVEAVQVQQEEEPVPLRRVSMEEANAYLSLVSANAKWVALAVGACILSPIPLLMLDTLGAMNRLNSHAAVLMGVIVLLMIMAVAVSVFVRWEMKAEPYEYLKKEAIETAYGVSGMVKEQQKVYHSTGVRKVILGVAMCIMSPVPLLCITMLTEIAIFIIMGVCVLLTMVAVAVYLFVSAGMMEDSFQRLLEVGDYTRIRKQARRSPWAVVYWCTVVALYLGWSFYSGDWQRTWLIWPMAGVLYGGLEALLRMKGK